MAYGGVDVCIHVFMTSALVRGVVTFTPQPLYPRGKSFRYPLDMSLGSPRTGLDDVKKTFLTLPGLEL
jgi:hypothetical protein